MTKEHGVEWKRLEEARWAGVARGKWGCLPKRTAAFVREDLARTGTPGAARAAVRRAPVLTTCFKRRPASFSDDKQRLCFALGLWNGKDAILKERLFGLTDAEGDRSGRMWETLSSLQLRTPAHSYMKWLYKYPQRACPYSDLIETNRRRWRAEFD